MVEKRTERLKFRKPLATYLYKIPVVSTLFALPSLSSRFRTYRHSAKLENWMDKRQMVRNFLDLG
jgi:hypothetical protein